MPSAVKKTQIKIALIEVRRMMGVRDEIESVLPSAIRSEMFITMASSMTPMTSSSTAAESMVVPSGLLIILLLESTELLMPTEVAVVIVPKKRCTG